MSGRPTHRKNELLDHLIDQLSTLGDARGRAMFGGWGVYLDGLIIGLIAFDTFYLKVDDQNRPDFEAAGSSPFTYEGKGQPMIMSYWECPADVLEDPDEFRRWALASLAASRRAAAKKPKKSPSVGATGRSPVRSTATRQQSKAHRKAAKDTKKKRNRR